jgi:hypothetical protein
MLKVLLSAEGFSNCAVEIYQEKGHRFASVKSLYDHPNQGTVSLSSY